MGWHTREGGGLKCGGAGEDKFYSVSQILFGFFFKKIFPLLNYCLFLELAGLGLFIPQVTYLFIHERC